jgi:hypothetical protein
MISMALLWWTWEMMQRELNQISNVVWAIVKQIAPSFKAKEEIDLDCKNFHTTLDNASSHYQMRLKNK